MKDLSPFFANKRILIITSASIALYKILDIISMLKKYNADVKVVMSRESKRFISPLSFEAMSGSPVLSADSEDWGADMQSSINHISYARWAQVVLVAPATANTIAKLAMGIADDITLSTALASNAPKLIAPAMNTTMLNAPQTKRNLQILTEFGYTLISPRDSKLVCGEYGNGALAHNEEIIFALGRALCALSKEFSPIQAFYKDRDVIISGGASREAIDSVRYISNHSSGKQASALARVLYMLGANVSLVSSSFPLALPMGVKRISVASFSDYESAINTLISQNLRDKKHQDSKPIVFMVAALADYAPTESKNGKIKKADIGEKWILECRQNKDLLASISTESAHKI